QSRNQRDHNFGEYFDAVLRYRYRSFKDGASLHLRDFGIGDAQTATAMPEHGVEFMQLLDPAEKVRQELLQVAYGFRSVVAVLPYQRFFLLRIHLTQRRDVDHEFFTTRQKFMERRIERPNGDGETIHGAENTDKIVALQRQKFFQGRTAVFFGARQNHGSH